MLLDIDGEFGVRDMVVVPCCFAVIIGYHVFYLVRLFRTPDGTSLGVNFIERQRWVQHIMTDDKNGLDILAVQTLRNLSMGASFLASAIIITAVAMLGVLLNASLEIGGFFSTAERDVSPSISIYWELRLGLIVMDLFSAFLCFSLTIRAATHASFLVSLRLPTVAYLEQVNNEAEGDHDAQTDVHVAPSWIDRFIRVPQPRTRSHTHIIHSCCALIGRATTGFFLGIRLMYLVVPLVAWLVNAYGLLVGTFLVLILFVSSDFL